MDTCTISGQLMDGYMYNIRYQSRWHDRDIELCTFFSFYAPTFEEEGVYCFANVGRTLNVKTVSTDYLRNSQLTKSSYFKCWLVITSRISLLILVSVDQRSRARKWGHMCLRPKWAPSARPPDTSCPVHNSTIYKGILKYLAQMFTIIIWCIKRNNQTRILKVKVTLLDQMSTLSDECLFGVRSFHPLREFKATWLYCSP